MEDFKLQLWLPPPDEEIPEESPWSAESETAAFGALKTSLAAK